MATQQSQTVSSVEGQLQHSHLRPVINLSELSGYSRFGDLLRTVRTNANVTQQAVAEALSPYFTSRKVPVMSERMYGDLERGRRAPSFDELEPLYHALTQGCAMSFSTVERELYVKLAKEKIQKKKKRSERISEAQWEQLAETLARLDETRRSIIQILDRGSSDHVGHAPPPLVASRSQEAIARALRTDTAHLVERDAWIEQMLSYLVTVPAKKLVTIQAISGAGKTSALTLLTKHLAGRQNYFLIPYTFSSGEDKTPDDHLDIFLGTLLTDLHVPHPDETKMRSLDDRTEQLLAGIIARSEQGVRTILLLDDAQEILEPTGELPAGWQQFFRSFVRYSHTATVYLATREWPGWAGGEQTYVVETELPPLSPEGGITVWKRFGFEDVPDEVLRRASAKCGGNPQMLELRAAHLQRPGFTYAWRGGGAITTRQTQKSENALRLEKFLTEEAVFDPKTDIQAREVLQQVISKRLSHQALQLLEILSASSIPVPFTLLDGVCAQAELAFDELMHCSLVNHQTISSQRAAVVPLVREARLHTLTVDQRKEAVEQQVMRLYEQWLYDLQEFRDDSEKSSVVAELLVLLMKQKQLLKAAELLINYGWLCALFGHMARFQRVYQEVTRHYAWKTEPESETGGTLLQYHMAVIVGEKINPWMRNAAYQKIRDYALTGQVLLQPHSEIYLAHYLLIPFIRSGRFTEAYALLQETFERISKSGSIAPEVHASFLQSKSYLLGRWSEDETKKGNAAERDRLRKECVETLTQGIALWRDCRADALPLQEHYINFKLARCLNDCAYYLRLLNRLEEAEKAIWECISLKEKGATLPRSLAVSLGEYAQILSARGRLRDALSYSDRALQSIEELIHGGDTSAGSDKGMLLIERAHICLQQARLSEAKQLFEGGLPLLSEFRQAYRLDAEEQLAQLQTMLDAPTRFQLDANWFERYLPLADYDDLQWLSQAGPFLEEEQREWESLFSRRHEQGVRQRLSELIVRSRQREFSKSLAEQRVPRITYPAIDIDDVRLRIQGFTALQDQIVSQERNAVVRRLYVDKIEEHLQILHLVEATYSRDTDGVRKYNELLYGKPTVAEVAIALREFVSMLRRAQNHPEAGALSAQLLKQLKQWRISPEDYLTGEAQKPENPSPSSRKELARKSFSPAAVQQFFEEVFSDYQFTEWRVVAAPERDNTSLDLDLCELYLPTRAPFSAVKVCELLAEEVETHMYRAVAGKKSPLALLGSGTRGYLPTDEGLAIRYVQQMRQAQGFARKSYSWITTLAPGMAAGVIFPPLGFGALYGFLEKAFLISNLLAGRYDTREEAEEAARQESLTRVARTFRAVPDPDAVGVCNLKDRVYLQGHLEVSKALETVEVERLLVGSIGIGQVEDMAELRILEPSIRHRHLALDPALLRRIAALDGHDV